MVGMKVEVVREVDVAELLGKPLTNFFNRAMLIIHRHAAQPGVVPIDTGLLRGSLSPGAGTTMIDPSNPPKFAQVGTNLVYGGVLDQADRFHYRGGPSSGQVTQGWLSSSLDKTGAEIDDALARSAEEMVALWKAAA